MNVTKECKNIYLGNTPIKKVFAGSDLVWQKLRPFKSFKQGIESSVFESVYLFDDKILMVHSNGKQEDFYQRYENNKAITIGVFDLNTNQYTRPNMSNPVFMKAKISGKTKNGVFSFGLPSAPGQQYIDRTKLDVFFFNKDGRYKTDSLRGFDDFDNHKHICNMNTSIVSVRVNSTNSGEDRLLYVYDCDSMSSSIQNLGRQDAYAGARGLGVLSNTSNDRLATLYIDRDGKTTTKFYDTKQRRWIASYPWTEEANQNIERYFSNGAPIMSYYLGEDCYLFHDNSSYTLLSLTGDMLHEDSLDVTLPRNPKIFPTYGNKNIVFMFAIEKTLHVVNMDGTISKYSFDGFIESADIIEVDGIRRIAVVYYGSNGCVLEYKEEAALAV